jgi:glycerophosphoryl diester phosphodiesterase
MAPHPQAPRAEGRPLVLGHRGASADAPENTIASFLLALDQGADGVELDVWRCGTGEVVVFHDGDALRLAGVPLAIARAPWGELRRLDVGSHKGGRFRGERIPLLAEVLEAIPGAVVNVELKSSGLPDPRLAAGVARILREGRAERRAIVSSFDWGLLAAFRLAAPRVATGLLFEPAGRWRWSLPAGSALLRPSAIHPPLAEATAQRMRDWSARGYAVNVWTVDAPDDVDRLCAAGAAGLVTNVPRTVREAVRRATGR